MGSQSNGVKSSSVAQKIDIKDLDVLLRQCFNSKDLQLIDFTATKLLPAGENYGSVMVKLDVKIRRNKITKEETLHLVGKTPSISENPMADWSLIFKKELFVYTELVPMYRELEKEAGIDDRDLLDILPQFVGYRNSFDGSEKADQDSVLLMENLKVKGYYMEDKRIGMDVHHARKALTSLARYHALGVVMRQKRPEFAEKVIHQAGILAIEFSQIDDAFTNITKVLLNIPNLKKYAAVIESTFERAKDGGCWKEKPIEPWATINHGDFWTNNILFHKDQDGKIDDVKFVDFQIYIYSSTLKDVARLLGCSIDVEAQTNHLEELLNLYFDVYLKTLKRMFCHVTAFTRESFDVELKRQMITELPTIILAHKFLVSDSIDDSKSNEENINSVVNDKPSDALIDRIMWVIKVYERMKWL